MTAVSPFAGNAIHLAGAAHPRAVSGSVTVSAAGAGGRLEVDLLAPRAALARAGTPTLVRVGRVVRSPVPAGVVRFKVSLDAQALRALHVRRRLALTVRIVLTPPAGAAVSLPGRSLLLHR